MAWRFLRRHLPDLVILPVNKPWALLCLSLLFFLPSCVTTSSQTAVVPSQAASAPSQPASAPSQTAVAPSQTEDDKGAAVMSFEDHLRLGRIYESNGNLRPALREYERARKMRKKDSRPYFGMGNIQLRSGDLDRAQWSYKKAIKYDPSVGVYYNNLAWVYIKMQRYTEAYAMATRGAELDLRRPYIYLDTIGVIEMRLGNFERAERKLKQAAAAMPPADRHGLLSVYENLRELYTRMMSRTDDIVEIERRISELKSSMGGSVPMLP